MRSALPRYGQTPRDATGGRDICCGCGVGEASEKSIRLRRQGKWPITNLPFPLPLPLLGFFATRMPLAPFECESHPRSRCSKAKSPRGTKDCSRWCKPPDWHQQNKSSSPGWGGGNCPSRFRRPLAGLVVIVNSNRWFAPPATFLHAYGVNFFSETKRERKR